MKYLLFLLFIFIVPTCAHPATNPPAAAGHYDAQAEADSITRNIAKQQFRDGIAYLNDQKYDDALNSFQTCLKMEPHNAAALGASGIAYAAKGDLTNALSNFNQSLQLRHDPAIYLNRGYLYLFQNKNQEAIADFTACLHLDKTNVVAFQSRASANFNLGKYKDAIADAGRALALFPGDSRALMTRAGAYAKSGQFDLAAADYEKATALTPGNAGYYNDYSWFLATCPDAKIRNGPKAATLATLACNQTGWALWQYVDTAAVALAAEGEFAKAIECEQQVLHVPSLDPQTRKDILARLDLFQKHQPYHEPAN